MLRKTWLSFLYLFSNVELELIHFIQHDLQQQKPPEVLNLKIEILLGFQKAVNGEIIVFWLKPLEFFLISPWKTSSRPVLKMCLGKMSWRYLEDVFSAATFRLPRMSSKRKSCLKDVLEINKCLLGTNASGVAKRLKQDLRRSEKLRKISTLHGILALSQIFFPDGNFC